MTPRTAERFGGWPPEALTFFAELEADNSRAWWQAHRPVYDAAVRGPMEALIDEVPERFRPLRVFRPNRDVRFSSGKRPYKTHIGAVSEREGGASFYVQLSAEGLMAASGYYVMAGDQLQRYREAVDDERAGRDLDAAVDAVARAGLALGGESLKTAPRGWPRDHPRIALLRRRSLYTWRSWSPAGWLSTRRAMDRVVRAWDAAEPVNEWLDAHVGPSTLPPPEPR